MKDTSVLHSQVNSHEIDELGRMQKASKTVKQDKSYITSH